MRETNLPRLLYIDGFRFFFSREGTSRHTDMLKSEAVSPNSGFLLWSWSIPEVSREQKYDVPVT